MTGIPHTLGQWTSIQLIVSPNESYYRPTSHTTNLVSLLDMTLTCWEETGTSVIAASVQVYIIHGLWTYSSQQSIV